MGEGRWGWEEEWERGKLKARSLQIAKESPEREMWQDVAEAMGNSIHLS